MSNNGNEGRPRRPGLSLTAAILSLAVAGVLLWLGLSSHDTTVSFTLTGLGGVIGVLAALALVSIALTNLGVYDQKQALGLPAGSIRAIIAVGLIVFFVIFAIYYFQIINPTRVITGLTPAQVGNLTADQIIATYHDGPETYAVVLQGVPSQASTDIAKQILTTLSTLVVAVSAFYFGTKSGAEKKKKEGED